MDNVENFKDKIPSEVLDVLSKISNSNYEAYLVGGMIRDIFLDRDNKDYDICTNMPMDELSRLFPFMTIMKENDHRNTGIIRSKTGDIEISTFRGNTLNDDLYDRDFKANAIALDKDGIIHDPYGGREDTINKKISLIRPNGEGIDIDPLRIVRGIRFAATLGFDIDKESYNFMVQKLDALNTVAKERIYTEFTKILLSDKPSDNIKKYREVYYYLIPELKDADGFNQNNPHHKYDVLNHTLVALDNTNANLSLRLGVLFHDLGKTKTYSEDENGIGHFYGHAKSSVEIFEKFASDMPIETNQKKLIKKLIEYHDTRPMTESKAIKRFLNKLGAENIDLYFAIQRADILALSDNDIKGKLEELDECITRVREVLSNSPCITLKDLEVNGSDMIELGLEGKKIGDALSALLDLILDEKIENKKDVLIKYVKENLL